MDPLLTGPTYNNQPRHLRLAQVLDFIGRRAHSEGKSHNLGLTPRARGRGRVNDECLALCRHASNRSAMGQLEVVLRGFAGY